MKQKRQQPYHWTVDNIIYRANHLEDAEERPEPLKFNLMARLRLAWGVFIGAYDVLDWEGQ